MDITSRKRDEEKLRQLNDTLEHRLNEYLAERKLFADIVEGTNALIQVLDLNFRVLANNRANTLELERIFGVQAKVGDDLMALIAHHPEEEQNARTVWSRALSGEAFNVEAEFGVPNMARRWYDLHFQPLYSPSGERIGAYQFGYDITSRKEAEKRLAETEAALQHAQRMESIGLLTGGVAHDFNNVLQALSTKFELIRRRPDDIEGVRSWAASGVEVTRRGARVTAQLLAFSRRQASGDRPIPLRPLILDMTDLFRTTLGPEIKLLLECDDVWVHADSTQLEMALLNLAVNAKDAMDGNGLLTIRAAAAHEEFVDITVTDTGPGMSSEVIAKAFTPFFTTKPLGKGSGLGLAQVYAMANRVGGSARIESDGHNGTSVVMTLRRVQPELEEQQVARHGGTELPDQPLAVLVVDDDTQVRTSLVELLRGLGHLPLEAAGGEEALSLLERSNVDILLCDFAMPGMNGVAVANLAREQRPHLKVIFMSGYADVDELTAAIGQSAGLLRKPFDTQDVHRVLTLAEARLKG